MAILINCGWTTEGAEQVNRTSTDMKGRPAAANKERMTLKDAAEVLNQYVTARQKGKTFVQTWHVLSQEDPHFQGLLQGYQNVRRRADRKSGKEGVL